MKLLAITLNEQEMQTVWNAVCELPGKVNYPILKKMEGQLGQQGAFPESTIPGDPVVSLVPFPPNPSAEGGLKLVEENPVDQSARVEPAQSE